MDAFSSLLCGLASLSLAAASHAISATASKTKTPTPAALAWALVGAGAAVSPLLLILPTAGHGPPSLRGALTGAVLSAACLLATPAAERLGAPAAAALAAAAASLSSFAASVGPAGDWSSASDVAILRPGLATPGLVALLLGAAACAASSRGDLAADADAVVVAAAAAAVDDEGSEVPLLRRQGGEDEEERAAAPNGDEEDGSSAAAPLISGVRAVAPQPRRRERPFWEGLALSLSAGGLAGTALVPMRKAPPPLRGLSLLPSVALGALVAGPSSAALLLRLSGESVATAAPRAVRARCALAGALLAAAVASSVVAASRSRGGLAAVAPAVAIGFAVAVSAIEVAAAERRRGRGGSPAASASVSIPGEDDVFAPSSLPPSPLISRPRSFALSLATLALGAGLLSASV